MREKTIGELLREGRTAAQLTFDKVEEKVNIPSHHLLALELDQLELLPEDRVEDYIQRYGQAVNLDTEELLRVYHQQIEDSNQALDEADEEVNKMSIEENQESEIEETDKSETGSEVELVDEQPFIEETATLEADLETEEAEDPSASLRNKRFNDDDETISISLEKNRRQRPSYVSSSNNNDAIGSRSSRYRSSRDRSSYVPIVMLCLVAIAILAFVGFIAWSQLQTSSSTPSSSTSYSVVNSTNSSELEGTSSKTEETSDSSATESSGSEETMTTTASDNTLSVTLSNTDSVEIAVSLTTADSCWVSITNTESGDIGTLLSSDTASYTTTLSSSATNSVITLGVTTGVSLAINGQTVDLSQSSSSAVTYVNLTIE